MTLTLYTMISMCVSNLQCKHPRGPGQQTLPISTCILLTPPNQVYYR